MQRLDFQLEPEWTRVIFVSEEAKNLWADRIARIVSMWTAIERASVSTGYRLATLQSVSPEDLPAVSKEAAKRNVDLIVLEQNGISMSNTIPYVKDKPWNYRVLISNRNITDRFLQGWMQKDNELMGKLLGYPICCREFFDLVWMQNKHTDTAWPMTGDVGNEVSYEDIDYRNNILLRYIGVRAVPFLPCSFNCVETRHVASNFKEVAIRSGFDVEWKWLTELLSAPIEWSAKGGIAEIKTSIFKISTRTDATGEKYIIKLQNKQALELQANGLSFPYNIKDTWTANGFKNWESMKANHDLILETARHAVYGTVLDLGCGNGLLLSKLAPNNTIGVDLDKSKLIAARELNPNAELIYTDLREYIFKPTDLCVVAINRFLEMPREDGQKLIEEIKKNCKYLLLYTYDQQDLTDLLKLFNKLPIYTNEISILLKVN